MLFGINYVGAATLGKHIRWTQAKKKEKEKKTCLAQRN